MATWSPTSGWKVYRFDREPYATSTSFEKTFPFRTEKDYIDTYPDKTENDFLSQYPDPAPDYKSYVLNNSDLEDYWQKTIKPQGVSRVQWGEWHWVVYGKNENRNLPLQGDLSTVQQQRRQAAADYNNQQAARRAQTATAYNTEQEKYRQTNADNVNKEIEKRNRLSEGLERWSQQFVAYSQNAQGGTYLRSRDAIPMTEIQNLIGQGLLPGGYDQTLLNQARDTFKSFYGSTKVQAWDPSLGAKDPAGKFDLNAYIKYNPAEVQRAINEYNTAVANDDIDITMRYNQDTYLHQDYTTRGRFLKLRASDPISESEMAATKYRETLTDFEKQKYRDEVLGITTDTSGKQKIVLAAPQYDEKGNLINQEEINTILEKTLAENIGTTDIQKEKQLGALTQDLLKTSIDELKKVKQKEANLTLMSGLPGYSELMEINSNLANSIIGDTGIGGMLSLAGKGKEYQQGIEKELEKITGMSSNTTVYNWQKWFDETLMKRYENYELETRTYGEDELKRLQASAKEEIEAYTKDPSIGKPVYLEVAEKYKENGRVLDVNNIDDFRKIMFNMDRDSKKEFVNSFIKDFIKPRFDQSKSMDEFISYLDVKEEEQNVFQSQTTINKLKQIADLRTKTFLDLVQASEKVTKNFDAQFYMDPITNKTKEVGAKQLENYQLQKNIFAQDFQLAKTDQVGSDGINWANEAYRYGFEKTYKTDPVVFAKLHYQVKGSTGMVKDSTGKSVLLDPAEDILPYAELEQKIKNFGADLAARKQFYGGAGFMQFVTPEEFADAVLGSVDPEKNKAEWEQVLKSIGLEGSDATVEQVKKYLVDQLRTEEAKQIRESIKYLNEKDEELNQKTLGASYIERPTDVKEEQGETTVLYNVFKNAGYNGTEDEFYSDFLPDVDRTEQELVSKASSSKGLEFAFGDMENPFQAFTSVSSLFGEDETLGSAGSADDEEEETVQRSSYFKIFGDEEEEEDVPQKSEAATSFLKDFTSMFKGFS